MPKLLPPGWIRVIAVQYLLQLYEKECKFVQEWDELKSPFAPLIEKIAKVSCLIHTEYILRSYPPQDLVAWVSNYTKLQKYLEDFPGNRSFQQLQENYDELYAQLAPYVLKLNGLAEKWNLRASWAADELLRRDIQRVEEDVFKAAEAEGLSTLSETQIHRLLPQEEGFSISEDFPVCMLSFYLAGGRGGILDKINDKLEEMEKRVKAAGAKEPPSALSTHAKWWFEHYVHNVKFTVIADKIAKTRAKSDGGPHPENIRKAIIKFSERIGVGPIEED